MYVQGWEEVNGEALQICAACNLPWLDTSFQLAPGAQMDSGQFLHMQLQYTHTPCRAATAVLSPKP